MIIVLFICISQQDVRFDVGRGNSVDVRLPQQFSGTNRLTAFVSNNIDSSREHIKPTSDYFYQDYILNIGFVGFQSQFRHPLTKERYDLHEVQQMDLLPETHHKRSI